MQILINIVVGFFSTLLSILFGCWLVRDPNSPAQLTGSEHFRNAALSAVILVCSVFGGGVILGLVMMLLGAEFHATPTPTEMIWVYAGELVVGAFVITRLLALDGLEKGLQVALVVVLVQAGIAGLQWWLASTSVDPTTGAPTAHLMMAPCLLLMA